MMAYGLSNMPEAEEVDFSNTTKKGSEAGWKKRMYLYSKGI